jgi:hypothetical protein
MDPEPGPGEDGYVEEDVALMRIFMSTSLEKMMENFKPMLEGERDEPDEPEIDLDAGIAALKDNWPELLLEEEMPPTQVSTAPQGPEFEDAGDFSAHGDMAR